MEEIGKKKFGNLEGEWEGWVICDEWGEFFLS